jgi:hypothetical protein
MAGMIVQVKTKQRHFEIVVKAINHGLNRNTKGQRQQKKKKKKKKKKQKFSLGTDSQWGGSFLGESVRRSTTQISGVLLRRGTE